MPSRITWLTSLPRRAVLNLSAAVREGEPDALASVTVRVGISDDRVYESLVEREVTSADSARGWTPIAVDLSAYAGPKLSLFYHPDRRSWHLVLAADPRRGRVGEVYWGEPGIDTDAISARTYVIRQRADARTRQ